MYYQNIPGIPHTKIICQNDQHKDFIRKFQNNKKTVSIPDESMLLQSEESKNPYQQMKEVQYKITLQRNEVEQFDSSQNINNEKIISSLKRYQNQKITHVKQDINEFSPFQNQSNYKSNNHYSFNQLDLYPDQLINQQKFKKILNPIPIKNIKPSKNIKQTQLFQDQSFSDDSKQVIKVKSNNNLKTNNIKKHKYPEQEISQNKEQNKKFPKCQQKHQQPPSSFNVFDLHLAHNQNNSIHNKDIKPQFVQKKTPSKNYQGHLYSIRNSRQNRFNHPIFQEMTEYYDHKKIDTNEKFQQQHNSNHRLSENLSSCSRPITNVDQKQSYKSKYKRYKQKYMSMFQVVHQFEKLNEELIQDQRQNFRYYEVKINQLEDLLTIKDKEIDELNNLLMRSKYFEERLKQLGSIEQQLKYESKNIQKTPTYLQKSKEAFNKVLQKKYQLLKKQKQALLNKVKSFQALQQIYEQKIKEKEQRVSKLSEMNSELQEQLLKLKNKIQPDETYDTDSEFRVTFAKKIFPNSKSSFYQPAKEQINFIKVNPAIQIQKYLGCIDNQLQLIRSQLGFKSSKNDKIVQLKNQRNIKIQQSSDHQLMDIMRYEYSNQKKEELLSDLMTAMNKLNNFRESINM